ncbi:MAG TPA: hypothetical protein VIW69_05970 [Candidatus Elarobacter sp.]
MRAVLTFAAFAETVHARLWLLGVEPEFVLYDGHAWWSCAPYAAEVQPIDRVRARVFLSAYGNLCHASEPGPMTAAGARTLADAIGILFGGSGAARLRLDRSHRRVKEVYSAPIQLVGRTGGETDFPD